LVKSLYWKWFPAIHSQIPVRQQIIVVNFDPCDNKLMLVWRKFTSQKSSVKNRVNSNLPLIICMNIGHMKFLGIPKEHTDQNPVKH